MGVLLIAGCTGILRGLTPVTGFDIEKYLGTGVEIVRLDHSFERNMTDVHADYSMGEKGDIHVENNGFDTGRNAWRSVEGLAKFIDPRHRQFESIVFRLFLRWIPRHRFGPEDYRYAMVVGPNRSYIWILARDKIMDVSVPANLTSQAEALGLETEKLIMVDHTHSNE